MGSLEQVFLGLCLIYIVIQDVREGIIPDGCLVILAILGLLENGFSHVLSFFLLGALGYFLYAAYAFLRKKEGLGLGDVKMMGVCGLWIPFPSLPLFLVLTGSFGIVTSFFYKKSRFPLGPALAFAAGICIFKKQCILKGPPYEIFFFWPFPTSP